MAEPKTRPTTASVDDYLDRVERDDLRDDCRAVAAIMQAITKAPPVMWGPSIVGFGEYCYRYQNGKALTWPLTGFAPRKSNLVLYVMPGFEGYDELMRGLGPHSHGVSCIYVRRLSDLHPPTLKKLVTASVAHLKRVHARAEASQVAAERPKARKTSTATPARSARAAQEPAKAVKRRKAPRGEGATRKPQAATQKR